MAFQLTLAMIVGVMIGGWGPVISLNTTEVNKRCNGQHYSWCDSYADFVGDVTAMLAGITSKNGYKAYYKLPNYDDSVAHCYGRAACGSHLSQSDCNSCLNEVLKYMEGECHYSVGAEFWLQDCRMRYEYYYFDDF